MNREAQTNKQTNKTLYRNICHKGIAYNTNGYWTLGCSTDDRRAFKFIKNALFFPYLRLLVQGKIFKRCKTVYIQESQRIVLSFCKMVIDIFAITQYFLPHKYLQHAIQCG